MNGDMTISLQVASLYNGQEVFVWSDCRLGLGLDFLVGNMVFVRDAWYLAVAPHFQFHTYESSAVVCAVLESISGLEPSLVITEPRYMKLVTVSGFCPLC